MNDTYDINETNVEILYDKNMIKTVALAFYEANVYI